MSDLTEPLNGGAVAPPVKKSPIIPVWIAIGIFIVAAAVASVFTYIFTKEHFKPIHRYDANKAFQIPDRFEVSVTMSLPEFPGFAHPILARVDRIANKMEVQYYNGVNRFIYEGAANGTTTAILPLFDQQVCRTTGHKEYMELPSMFPHLEYFTKSDDKEFVNSVECDVWTFNYYHNYNSNGYHSLVVNEKGYSGSYKFYVNKDTGLPVRFVVDGKNVILGGSHPEKYIFDYSHFQEVKDINPSAFVAPYGMYCEESEESFGPTMRKSHTFQTTPMHTVGLHAKFLDVVHSHGHAVDTKEYNERFNNFVKAEQLIQDAKAQGKSYTLEHNELSFALDREMATGRRTKSVAQLKAAEYKESACDLYNYDATQELPKTVDWADHTVQTTQGSCGSCFAMAAKGMLDGQLYKNKIAGLISQQYLVDCSAEQGVQDDVDYSGNLGCSGGLDYKVLSWVLLRNQGRLVSAAEYGNGLTDNLNINNFCHYYSKTTLNPYTNKEMNQIAAIKSCTHVNTGYLGENTDQEQLVMSTLHALREIGPLSISIAVPQDFYLYRNGIYDNLENCPNSVEESDHSVVAVGYTIYDDGSITLRLRNSWSSKWGNNGFADVLVKTKEGKYVNVCGVASSPVFATLAL